MLTLAVNMIRKGKRVGIFSAEMSSLQLGKRVLAIGSGENIRTIDAGGGKQFGALFNTIVEIGDSGKIFVNDTPNILLEDLVRNARAMKRKEAVDIIFVDYLSLIRHGNPKLALWERIGEVTQKLKELSRELDIPIVVLSQVTRDTEGKEPSLATLRYSGSVEQDADVIMFLHREREEAEVNQSIQTQVIIAKNRNGETGRAEVLFVPSQTKFVNEAKR
jgi:replicative DNA helicase